MCKRPHYHYIFLTLLLTLCSTLSGGASTSTIYHITTNNTETDHEFNCAILEFECLTLTQFAANVDLYLNPNYTTLSLVFQPGTHYLDTNVSLSDLETFLIVPENSTAQILCTNHSHFQLSGSEYVYVTNVEFVGCGGNEVTDVKEFVLQGVQFKGEEETVTALELINTTAVINGSTFESNKKGKLMCISRDPEQGCEFEQSVGGAIIAIQSEIDIHQSMFKDNQADKGAVLFAEQQSIINVNNSTVTDNKGNYIAVVYLSESIITIRESNFNANIAHGGAGIHSVKSNVTIEASRFENNIGGFNMQISAAVLYSESCYVTVRMSEFYNNSAIGGGVFHYSSSNVTILASKFSDNRAWFGGVLHSEDSDIEIDASQFSNNSGSWGGSGRGGVVHSERSFITIKASQFFNSTADSEGGVVYSQDSTITIETSNFNGNKVVYGYGVLARHEEVLSVYGEVLSSHGSTITINASKFDDSHAMFEGGNVLYSRSSTIIILGSRFTKLKNNITRLGGVVYSDGSTIIIQGSEFSNSNAINGAVLRSTSDDVFIHSSMFYDNSANYGGVFNSDSSNVTIDVCVFRNNYAINGAVLYADSSTVNIDESEFESNLATANGILCSKSSTIVVKTSEFCENIASLQGGVLYSERSNVTFSKSNFTGNNSPVGAVIYATDNSMINYSSLLVTNNSAENYALIYLTESEFYGQENTSGNSIFSHNLGSLVAFNSNITLKAHDTFMHTKPPQSTVDAFQEGGVITLFQSNAFFDGVCIFEYNHAENGGAILSIESKIYVNGDVMIKNNIATRNGGGVYLSYSELNCQRRSTFFLFKNTANHKGGGLHAISSPIKATSSVFVKFCCRKEYTGSKLYFHENKAVKGGGLSLEANAKLYILKYNSIIVSEFLNDYDTNTTIFTGNSAQYGGAIYVDDETNSGTCTNDPKTECFFQVLAINDVRGDLKQQSIQFSHNHANVSGSTLYGGLLDRCAVSQFAEVQNKFGTISDGDFYGSTYFKNISTSVYYNVTAFGFTYNSDGSVSPDHLYEEILITNFSISSSPVWVCLCVNNVHDCTHQENIQVKKGELFTLSLAAVDQVGKPVDAIVQTSLNFMESGISEGQLSREIPAQCTDLTFNVVSPHDSETLTLYASDGPCKDAELSRRAVEIKFLPCSCRIGLQISSSTTTNQTNCTCECHSNISQYVVDCDSRTGSFIKDSQSRAWISYSNDTNASGYLIYPNCPFDYCNLSGQIRIDLNQQNGSDAQCALHRSSLLCGSCQPGLSLSLGSSHCLPCPSYWPALLIAITIAAILAGIALVTLLLVLNATVTVGTFNGLIFYANIVYANKSILLPFQDTRFVTVFVSWMNLDIGIDTCYFQGMDTYTKTWLQLAFPAYVTFLVVLIIIISHYSMRFSNLIGKKNPVATLATLILLSYAKFLAVCFKSLSVGILEYPDGLRERLWLPDATIKYLSGKHIPLYIVTILILLVGLFYTALLFFWQWLLYLPNWRIFRFTRDPKIKTFVETYHTPYTPKHRYWTGLLLIVRIVLNLVATINVSNDPTVSLTAIIFTVCCILGLKSFISRDRLYRKWSIDILETFFYLNILFFAVFTWYSLPNTNRDQKGVAYTSVIISFVALLLIILYHVYTFTSVFSKIKKTSFGKIFDRLSAESDPKPKPGCRETLPPDDDIHQFNELLDMID